MKKSSLIACFTAVLLAAWWSPARAEAISPERLVNLPEWTSTKQSAVVDFAGVKFARQRSLKWLSRDNTERTVVAPRSAGQTVFDRLDIAQQLMTPPPPGKRSVSVDLHQQSGRVVLSDPGVTHVIPLTVSGSPTESGAYALAKVASAFSTGGDRKRALAALAEPSRSNAATEALPLKLHLDARNDSVTVTSHAGETWTFDAAMIKPMPPAQVQRIRRIRDTHVAQRGS